MKIVIWLDGGLVQDVFYHADDDPDLSAIVIDEDTEGLEDYEMIRINCVDHHFMEVEPIKAPKTVESVFAKVGRVQNV